MKQLWDKLDFAIINQVLLRALPVLVLSVSLMGLAGWLVFVHDAVENRTREGQHAMGDLVQNLERSAVEEGLAHLGGLDSALGQRWRVVVDRQGGVQLQAESRANGDAKVAASGPNRDCREAWLKKQSPFLRPGFRPSSWEGVRPAGEPRQVAGGPDGGVVMFSVVLDEDRAWIPLLLNRRPESFVVFLPLAELFPPLPEALQVCLTDPLGRIVYSNRGCWREGTVLPGEAGHQQVLRTEKDFRTRLTGRWWAPSLAMTMTAGTNDLVVHSLDPMSDLHRTVAVFLLVMLLTATMVVVATTVIIRRVLGAASDQLGTLSTNMEALARGEFSRRMARDKHDEVGALAGYFNIMAASLEESHRQIKERASHLRAALENMRMLDQAKDDFLVLISHEVRTPLTAIMGGVDYLRKAAGRVNEEDRRVLESISLDEIVQIIRSSSDRLSEFMTDAIQMTALGSADARLNLRPMAVGDLLGGCLLELERQAREKGVVIDNQMAQGSDWSLLCDPEVLGVGLEKILHNAVRHNHQGGRIVIREAAQVPGQGPVSELIDRECLRRLEEQQAFRRYEDEDLVWRLVEVYNTGKPIPAERRAALFGKFELVGRIQNHKKGSGLSLPIAKAAVESHGGRILLGAGDREGNSFFLLLPTLEAETVARLESGEQLRESVRGGAWNEDVRKPGNTAALDVELDDLCSAILGGVDQAGGGVDGPGGAHHEEDVTVGRGLE